MKRLAILCGLILSSVPAHADIPITMQGKYRSTLGVDLDYMFIKPSGDFKYLSPRNKAGTAIYAAYRINRIFGVEMGYHWTDDKPETFIVVPGQKIFGAITNVTGTFSGTIRIKDTYFDGYAHWPINNFIEVKAGVGVGFMHGKIKVFMNQNSGGDPLWIALNNLEGKVKAIARLSVGMQALFNKRIGGRFLITFQTTDNCKAVGTIQTVDPRMFNNSVKVAAGLYWNLYGTFFER